MISQPSAAPQAPSSPATSKRPPLTPGGLVASPLVDASIRIGVGIDSARYGPYAALVRDDLQPAAAELAFTESAAGYAQLQCQVHGDVIDLWAALHHQTLRQAALELARIFDLEPAATKRTEKRNG